MNEQEMMENYNRSLRLKSWADLFGFVVEMGRDDNYPWISIDGNIVKTNNTYLCLGIAACAMGMDIKDLDGEIG